MIERCGADHKSDNDRDDDNVGTGRYDDHENSCLGENENHIVV